MKGIIIVFNTMQTDNLENLVCDLLSLVNSFIQSNKDIWLAFVLFTLFASALKDR